MSLSRPCNVPGRHSLLSSKPLSDRGWRRRIIPFGDSMFRGKSSLQCYSEESRFLSKIIAAKERKEHKEKSLYDLFPLCSLSSFAANPSLVAACRAVSSRLGAFALKFFSLTESFRLSRTQPHKTSRLQRNGRNAECRDEESIWRVFCGWIPIPCSAFCSSLGIASGGP